MAKSKAAVTIAYGWPAPAVTREEALTYGEEYQDDGDRALDQMVRQMPEHIPTEWEKYEAERQRQIAAIQLEEFEKSRKFEISITERTGK